MMEIILLNELEIKPKLVLVHWIKLKKLSHHVTNPPMIQFAIRLFIANQNTENLKNQMEQKIKLIDRRNIRWIIQFHFQRFRVNVRPQTKIFGNLFLGEFENQKSVEISTEHDSSDFDAGIRNFASSDDRWKMGGGEQSFSSSNQKTDSIIEQMSVVSSKNDSW